MLASSVVVLVLMVVPQSLPRLAVVETAMLGTAGRVADAAAAAAPAAVAVVGVTATVAKVTGMQLGTRGGATVAEGIVIVLGVIVVVAANWVGKRG